MFKKINLYIIIHVFAFTSLPVTATCISRVTGSNGMNNSCEISKIFSTDNIISNNNGWYVWVSVVTLSLIWQ